MPILMYVPDDLHQFLDVGMGETCSWFVQDQEVGTASQSTGDLEKTLSAVGKVLGRRTCLVMQPDQFEQGQGSGLGAALLPARETEQHQRQGLVVGVLHGHHDVVQRGQLRKDLQVLKCPRDPRSARP